MELGEKLRQARLEAGLSQRQLCGGAITRNMLSQIESGKAGPSVATLQYLAQRLGKPVSYFLQEETAVSPNLQVMEQARQAFGRKNYAQTLNILSRYRRPDPLFDAEQSYLQAVCALEQGKKLLEEGRALEAVPLLENLPRTSIYYREEMDRQRRSLLARGYELLEQHYKQTEDYKRAYEYACKARTLP